MLLLWPHSLKHTTVLLNIFVHINKCRVLASAKTFPKFPTYLATSRSNITS